MISQVSKFFRARPLLKGMAIYSIIWPASSIAQQLLAKEQIDFKRSFRFFLFGTFLVAPSLHGWIRLTSQMWPQTTLRTGIAKSLTEQISYGPAAAISFFVIMSLMEGKSFKEARMEVVDKFPPTFKVAIWFWTIFQIINFSFIKERNRVPFVALASFCWTVFLAYMKTGDRTVDDQMAGMEDEDIESSRIDESMADGRIINDKMIGN
ncbi:mpv17-like protein [Chironomus tepperi]|uniref:mpv17-like protein n=1 Tax=Chironomus tepperi TaxID=113505 RepID=UPI00391F5B6C